MSADRSFSEPREWRRGLVTRSTAELLVIVVGVVIGLAVDRWMAGIDDSVKADRFTVRLLADLRSDSILLEGLLESYEGQDSSLVAALRIIADPRATVEDPTAFIRTVELSSWWVPMSPNTSTWDEINSTGQLGLFEPEIRTALSEYYRTLTTHREIEARWAPAFQEYWNLQQPELPPLLRIAAIDYGPGGALGRPVTKGELAPVLDAFRQNDALHGALGRLAGIYRYGRPVIRGSLAAANRTIEVLEAR